MPENLFPDATGINQEKKGGGQNFFDDIELYSSAVSEAARRLQGKLDEVRNTEGAEAASAIKDEMERKAIELQGKVENYEPLSERESNLLNILTDSNLKLFDSE